MGNSSSNPSKFGAKSTTDETCLGVDLTGQVAIVTGCSAGIGIETAKTLLKQGCTVVMANRNQEKSQKAKEKILIDLGYLKPQVEEKEENKEEQKTEKKEEKEDNKKPNEDTKDEAKKDEKSPKEDAPKDDTEAAKDDNAADAPKEEANKEEANKEDTNKDETAPKADTTEEEKKVDSKKEDETKEEEQKVDPKVTAEQLAEIESRIILLALDLSSLQSVYDFVESFINLNLDKPLRLLVNNAGVMAMTEFNTSKDGIEMQFATNVLGHFYLTLLLINHYKEEFKQENKNIRIINVASSAHSQAPKTPAYLLQVNKGINAKDGPAKEDYGAWTNYGISKAGNILMSRELVERDGFGNGNSKETGIYSYSLHPGVIMTELQRHMPAYQQKIASWVFSPKTIPQGAATTIYCCCQELDKLANGEYYADCNEAFNNKLRKDLRKGAPAVKDLQSSLWDWCELLISTKGFNFTMPNDTPYESKILIRLKEEEEKAAADAEAAKQAAEQAAAVEKEKAEAEAEAKEAEAKAAEQANESKANEDENANKDAEKTEEAPKSDEAEAKPTENEAKDENNDKEADSGDKADKTDKADNPDNVDNGKNDDAPAVATEEQEKAAPDAAASGGDDAPAEAPAEAPAGDDAAPASGDNNDENAAENE